MKCIYSSLSLVGVLLCLNTASAFAPRSQPASPLTKLGETKQEQHMERAVKCAEKYGLCNVDELLDLADELEKVKGCVIEKDSPDMTLDTCEKEIQDRLDVADVLRLQSELMRRQEYLRDANLFDDNVHQMENRNRRDEYFKVMQYYSEY